MPHWGGTPLPPGSSPPGVVLGTSPHPYLMVWLMMMGSGCCRSPASFMGISEKRMRTQLKIWRGRVECLAPDVRGFFYPA